MSYLLALMGSVISIAALWIENDFRRRERNCICAIAKRVAWRSDESLGNNLRQLMLLLGAALLCTFYSLEGAAVYVGLQSMLFASALLWYLKNFELAKSLVRVAIAAIVGVLLYETEHVQGIHWVGFVGLELLGLAFVLTGQFVRDLVQCASCVVLFVYGILGMLIDDEGRIRSHITSLLLNAAFGAMALRLLLGTMLGSRSSSA